MPNYQRGRHKKWLHHFVIKWKEAFLQTQEDVPLTKMFTLYVLTFFFLMTAVSCEHNLQKKNLSKQGPNVDIILGNQNKKGIQITSNSSTQLDCKDWKTCSWTWDSDNFTSIDKIVPSSRRKSDFPGQHGFFSTDYNFLKKFRRRMGATKANFSFPSDKKEKKNFLFLLGRPKSNWNNDTEKRIVSPKVQKTGPACALEMTMWYNEINGARIEFGIQTGTPVEGKASLVTYSEFYSLLFVNDLKTVKNDSSNGWKTFKIPVHQYNHPFNFSIDVKRSIFHSPKKSFLAISELKLVNCAPPHTINCEDKETSYFCHSTRCLDGPSFLCDQKQDCEDGEDEKETYCNQMPEGAKCDFDSAQIHDGETCGWKIPQHHSNHMSENPQYISNMKEDSLLNIKLPLKPHENIILLSPVFPPPPDYNNDKASALFESCKIRLDYQTNIRDSTLINGAMHWQIHYVNDVSRPIRNENHIDEEHFRHMAESKRWELKLRNIKYRYYLKLVVQNLQAFELLIDKISLSPYCFGLGQGVNETMIGNWKPNMSDEAFCELYGRSDCYAYKLKTQEQRFTTCNKQGPIGPEMEDCEKVYKYYKTKVSIGHSDDHDTFAPFGYSTGIQRWIAPTTGIYTIYASGASGGAGYQNFVNSKADQIRALVKLSKGEQLFILVGQMGVSGCKTCKNIKAKASISLSTSHFRKPRHADASSKRYSEDNFGFVSSGVSAVENDDHASISFHTGRSYSNQKKQKKKVGKVKAPHARTANREPALDQILMALEDRSYDRDGNGLQSSDYHDLDNNAENHFSMGDMADGFDGRMVGHSPVESGRENYDSVDYASKLKMRSESEKSHHVGGGGGGATFIFKVFKNKTIELLLVAAGGGGASSNASSQSSDFDAQGLLYPRKDYRNSIKVTDLRDDAGSGGGWNQSLSANCQFEENMALIKMDESFNNSQLLVATGCSLNHSWMGGFSCHQSLFPDLSLPDYKWVGAGGFGGGGGSCKGGGGGGGFIGGAGGFTNTMNGKGGWSYYNPSSVLKVIGPNMGLPKCVEDSNIYVKDKKDPITVENVPSLCKVIGDGIVQILSPSKHTESLCHGNCSSKGAKCVALDMDAKIGRCLCPNGIILDHLNPQCSNELPLLQVVAIVIACLVSAAILGLLCLFLYTQYQRKHVQMLRDKMMSGGGPDGQLNRLRNMNGTGGMMMTEYNPNYEFGGGTCTIQDLKEIPRENLRLVKALGQGAFGEVYQGYFKKNLNNDSSEMAVAVKTLPELSSNQAEMDFLMEALIMSKFNHPNIVHFIGVCFDKHPRFIVLELLAGGDLKTFLRDSRPKPDRASPLVMKDLLLCAMDVAKGCEYLEGNHFIHRDIAARNCLLTTKSSGRVVKIADFGMARDIYRADYYRKGGKAMLPVKWMPPEAFLDGIFTSKTDVWSFGILLWEVMSLGYMPYPGRGNQEVMQLVTNGGRLEPPNYCPGPVYGLMCQCWHPIPEERPNFRTILERVGYCMQDPEVVMAPLPMFHRPLSLDNSRETSLSSGRGVVLSGPDTSNESGGAISLPLSGSGGSAGGGSILHKQASMGTPDTPSTAHTLAEASSSDYLVPLAGMGGSTGSISTLPQDNINNSMYPTQKMSNGATSKKSQSQTPHSKMSLGRDQRRRSNGHPNNSGFNSIGHSTAPSTPSDNEGDLDNLQGKATSRRHSRGSSYAIQKSGSRDSLRYKNPNMQAETSFSYSPGGDPSVSASNNSHKARKRSPGVTYTTLAMNKQPPLYDDRRSSSGSSSQNAYNGSKPWQHSNMTVPNLNEGNQEEISPLFPQQMVAGRGIGGDNSSTSSSSYSGQTKNIRNSSRPLQNTTNIHSNLATEQNRHGLKLNPNSIPSLNHSATVIGEQHGLPTHPSSGGKLVTAEQTIRGTILHQPELTMVGASPPEEYGNSIQINNPISDVPSPVLPPLPPLPIDESPIQLDVASLPIAPNASCLGSVGNSNAHGNLRYMNNLTVGSIGGGVCSGGDNNSITTGTGSVISSSIGATGSEGSSTPIASPPSSIHGMHPLSKKKPINSPPYVINSSSSSAASSGIATGTNGRRRNKEPPPSEISV